METTKRSVGDNIRELRELEGISTWKLAQRAGLNFHTLWQWERGARSPGAVLLRRVAHALSVPMERLLEGVEEGGAPTVQGEQSSSTLTG